MRYDLYFGFRTVLRYAIGIAVFSLTIHKVNLNSFIVLMVVIAALSLMKSWTPFKKESFQNQLYAPRFNVVAIVHIVVGFAFFLLLDMNDVEGYGIIIIAHLLRSGVEEEINFFKYVERLSIDFTIIISGFVLSQSFDNNKVFITTCTVLSVLTVLRYFNCRKNKSDILDVRIVEVGNDVES